MATGKAGPSAAPRITRLPTSVAKPETRIIGSKAADQATLISSMSVLVRIRLARNPTATPERVNKRKNALPSIPYCMCHHSISRRLIASVPDPESPGDIRLFRLGRSGLDPRVEHRNAGLLEV